MDMRRTNLFGRLGRDRAASAPFAVVAVVILLGAGISYTYLASYRSTQEAAEDRPAWADGPQAALEAEQARVEAAVGEALDAALDPSEALPSGTIVSAIGSAAERGFLDWANSTYPRMNGTYLRALRDARLLVVPVYGRVLAGNPIGQQTYQTLPVGVEAVAAATVEVGMVDRSVLSRDVVVRVDRPCPRLLAAHFQNVLEYELAEDGLVPALVSDALSTALARDYSFIAREDGMRSLLERALLVITWSLFRTDRSMMSPMPGAGPEEGTMVFNGGALAGFPEDGRISLELPKSTDFRVVFPPTGETLRFRFAPTIETMDTFKVEVASRNYAAAEAKGHGNASAVRLTYGVEFDHKVACLQDGRFVGLVERRIESRATAMGWAWDRPGLEVDGKRNPQVEDWDDFNATMSVAGSATGNVSLRLDGQQAGPSTVILDGVYLGEYKGPDVILENVAVGRHELTVQASMGDLGDATCSTTVVLGPDGTGASVSLSPGIGQGDAEDFTFWFSLMASYHRPGSTRIPYLDYIAQLSGYPPAPAQVAVDPEEHLGELVFWEEGLARHLERMGDVWTPVDGPVKGSFWHKASDVLSIYKEAHKLLVKLPKEVIRQGSICILLSSQEGRTVVRGYLKSQNDAKELFKAESMPEGFLVTFGKENPRLVTSFKSGLALLSVVSSAYSVWKDAINVGEALDDGWSPRAGFAVLNITIDIVRTVMAAVTLLKELGLVTLSELAKGCMGIISAAISVITAFLSAYQQAGGDVWAAFAILGHPDTFSAALRTAAFLQGIVTLYVAVVVGVVVPALTGAIVTVASAAAMSTGVGLIVFGLALAVWAILNWEKVQAWFRGWLSGTATQSEVKAAREGIEDMLASTMSIRAQLNGVDVEGELYRARLERGTGLGLMEARAFLSDDGLVGALGRQDLRHLDDGASQARRAKAVAELRYWIEVLWREVDDFVDEDSTDKADGLSEGFTDDKGTFGVDHDFRADIHVTDPDGLRARLSQRDGTLMGFLRGLDAATADGSKVELDVYGKDGRVYGPALRNWNAALDSICAEVRRCVDNITVASREVAYAALLGSGSEYRRDLSIVEIVTGEDVPLAQVDVISAGLWMNGTSVEGWQRVEIRDGARMLVVTPGLVESIMYGPGIELEQLESRCNATAPRWCDPSFGRTVLDHKAVVAKATATKG